MIVYFILFVVNRVLAGLCPFTSKIGGALSYVTIIATWALMALTFFFAPRWWYGLVMLGVYFIVPILLPKIDPDRFSDKARVASGILADVNRLLVVVLFLMLFNVI